MTCPPHTPQTELRNGPHKGEGGSKRRVCRLSVTSAIALLLSLLPLTAHAAGDVAAGKRKALQCQTCHGLDGLAKLPDAPHIAGQPEPYLVKSLNDYRKGVRQHDMMTLVVRDLTGFIERARAHGCEMATDEPLPGYDRIFVYDPFGNRIELIEPIG